MDGVPLAGSDGVNRRAYGCSVARCSCVPVVRRFAFLAVDALLRNAQRDATLRGRAVNRVSASISNVSTERRAQSATAVGENSCDFLRENPQFLAGINSAHAAEDAREAEERIDHRRGDADARGHLAHRADQRIELDGPRGLHVLQHGSLEGTEP